MQRPSRHPLEDAHAPGWLKDCVNQLPLEASAATRLPLRSPVKAKEQEPMIVVTKGSGSDVWLKPKLVPCFRWRFECCGVEEGDALRTRRSVDGHQRWR